MFNLKLIHFLKWSQVLEFYVRTTISMDCIKHYISGYKSCLDNKETVTNCVV